MLVEEQIKQEIADNPCVLFMKGSIQFPQCGFSAHAVAILRKYNVSFKDINILEDPELRQAMKVYSDWPTFPQLYVNGEFIGGVDIMQEMDNAGELTELFSALVTAN